MTNRLEDHLEPHFAEPLPVRIEAVDEPDQSGASHEYKLERLLANEYTRGAGYLQFQKGPRNEEGSTEGISDAAVISVVLDRLRGFQNGPYRCRENAVVITKLEEAMMWMAKRQNDRHARGVLGKNAQ